MLLTSEALLSTSTEHSSCKKPHVFVKSAGPLLCSTTIPGRWPAVRPWFLAELVKVSVRTAVSREWRDQTLFFFPTWWQSSCLCCQEIFQPLPLEGMLL